MFALQSRQRIVKSNLNKSVSKQLWSFSKTKRFARVKTQCPVAFYQQDLSTVSNKKIRFTASKRKVFTQVTDAPLPGSYQTLKQKVTNIPLFAESRDKCIFRSYVSRQIAQNPGPNKYEKLQENRSKGYTMRPRTANQRNYFIDDKERIDVPGPSNYVSQIQHEGVAACSKFRSPVLGNIGLMKKSKRFPSYDSTNALKKQKLLGLQIIVQSKSGQQVKKREGRLATKKENHSQTGSQNVRILLGQEIMNYLPSLGMVYTHSIGFTVGE